MMFVTAANHRYAGEVAICTGSLAAHGYDYQVYDLGGLNYGIPLPEEDVNFKEKGYYETQNPHWHSRSLFKPRVVQDALKRFGDRICWLDADTEVKQPLKLDGGYDIGVALRHAKENKGKAFREGYKGAYNAGVIIFDNNPAVRQFVDDWNAMTLFHGNDQYALNQLLLNSPLNIKEFSWRYNSIFDTEDIFIYHKRHH